MFSYNYMLLISAPRNLLQPQPIRYYGSIVEKWEWQIIFMRFQRVRRALTMSRTCVHMYMCDCIISNVTRRFSLPVIRVTFVATCSNILFFFFSFYLISASEMPNFIALIPFPFSVLRRPSSKKILGIAKARERAFSISTIFPPLPFPPSRYLPREVTLYVPCHYILIFQDSMISLYSPSCAQLNR